MSEKNLESPLTIRHWLLQATITSVIVCVVILGLGALFLPDGIVQLGQSPAIKSDQELIDTQQMHQRLTLLEQQLTQSMQPSDTPVEHTNLVPVKPDTQETAGETAAKLERTAQAAEEYEQRIRQLQEEAMRENYVARMIFGITQLKNAYDTDSSLHNGIQLLKNTIKDQNLQENLVQLDQIAQEKLPTKQEILHYIHTLQGGSSQTTAQSAHTAQNTTAQNTTAQNTPAQGHGGWIDTLKARTENMIGQVVKIRPTNEVHQQKILDRIAQAVQASDYSLASKLSDQLPATPSAQGLVNKLDIRAKAQNLIHTISTGIANTVSNPNTRGALY